jgi:hypothetical protein
VKMRRELAFFRATIEPDQDEAKESGDCPSSRREGGA